MTQTSARPVMGQYLDSMEGEQALQEAFRKAYDPYEQWGVGHWWRGDRQNFGGSFPSTVWYEIEGGRLFRHTLDRRTGEVERVLLIPRFTPNVADIGGEPFPLYCGEGGPGEGQCSSYATVVGPKGPRCEHHKS